MKRCRMLLSLLLTLLVFLCALTASAQESEKNLLPIDLQQLKTDGCCFEGVLPGASFQEVAAVLSLDETTDKSNTTDLGSSRTCMLSREFIAQPDGLRTKAANFQFLNDRLACIDLYLDEELDAQAVIERLTSILGDASEISLPSQEKKLGYAIWIFEANSESIEWGVSLIQREGGARCVAFSVLYRTYMSQTK